VRPMLYLNIRIDQVAVDIGQYRSLRLESEEKSPAANEWFKISSISAAIENVKGVLGEPPFSTGPFQEGFDAILRSYNALWR
jgi:hypothetical protein